jgi:hypothetical protein
LVRHTAAEPAGGFALDQCLDVNRCTETCTENIY